MVEEGAELDPQRRYIYSGTHLPAQPLSGGGRYTTRWCGEHAGHVWQNLSGGGARPANFGELALLARRKVPLSGPRRRTISSGDRAGPSDPGRRCFI